MTAKRTRCYPSEIGYNARLEVIKALSVTILLGILFTYIQLYEYKHSLFNISDGIYGSLFFLLTGFHGFHVLVGTIFLCVCLIRHVAYHFSRDHHVGLEIAIWY
jgi:heme/copper-type cytochrome/quinol oxidase subunit 3